MINYIISVVISVVLALIFRMPILPKDKFSFKTTVVFPTPILALGFYVILKHLFFDNIYISVISGILGFLFSFYADKIFGEP
ncbi:energy-converting NiFe hydrogenase A subunit EhaA [Methanocaldococcus indicus]|uniref:energy-converting NiFe hydrogenase A subunit EhaA n=1 Tax=Methanocaldococcus indicus TaxID=213231 RepID=UPI003C6D2800